ncbi:GntR family transcriptional regulator [Salinifilum ghardaiensis]
MAKLGQSVSRQSAAEQVYRILRAKIEDGSLAPGEQLADGELAAELGVSRTPVREALRRLVDQGAVETASGRHTRVTGVQETDAAQVFPLLGVLHEFAARCALPQLTTADFDEMQAANDRMRAAIDSGDATAAREADQEFHAVLVRRADNPYLSASLDVIALHARRLETTYFQDRRPGLESHHQHQQIIEALRSGREDTACGLVHANTRRGPGHR